MAPIGHFYVGVACIQRGYQISGCLFLEVSYNVVCTWHPKQCCDWMLFFSVKKGFSFDPRAVILLLDQMHYLVRQMAVLSHCTVDRHYYFYHISSIARYLYRY